MPPARSPGSYGSSAPRPLAHQVYRRRLLRRPPRQRQFMRRRQLPRWQQLPRRRLPRRQRPCGPPRYPRNRSGGVPTRGAARVRAKHSRKGPPGSASGASAMVRAPPPRASNLADRRFVSS
jgi:hypothetical protein